MSAKFRVPDRAPPEHPPKVWDHHFEPVVVGHPIRVRRMWTAGWPVSAIAVQLGRPESDVMEIIDQFRLAADQAEWARLHHQRREMLRGLE